MTHDATCVEWLKSKPLDLSAAYAEPDDALFSTGRMALFTGFLQDSLQNGPR
jgi:hypothetical protein